MDLLLIEDNPADVRLVREALQESGLALRLHWAASGEEALGFLQRQLDLDANPQIGARMRVLYAGLQYCPLFQPYGRARLSLCGGAEAGAIQSRSVGLGARGRDSVSPLLNATAAARVAVRLAGTFSFYAGAGLSIPLMRAKARRARRPFHSTEPAAPIQAASRLAKTSSVSARL